MREPNAVAADISNTYHIPRDNIEVTVTNEFDEKTLDKYINTIIENGKIFEENISIKNLALIDKVVIVGDHMANMAIMAGINARLLAKTYKKLSGQ